MTAVTKDAATTEPVTDDSGFIAGLKSGWAALLGFLGWVGGAFGAVLPFLPLIVGRGRLVWWVIRRRPAAALAAGAGPTPRRHRRGRRTVPRPAVKLRSRCGSRFGLTSPQARAPEPHPTRWARAAAEQYPP